MTRHSTRRQQQLSIRYYRGCDASEARQWDRAIGEFSAVVAADPSYRDAKGRLERAEREQSLAGLRAELAGLYQARQWEAVIAVWDRIIALDAAAGDPEGHVESARAELAAMQTERWLDDPFREGVRALDAASWTEAIYAFEDVTGRHPDYPDAQKLLARAIHGLAEQRRREPGNELMRVVHVPWEELPLAGARSITFSPDGTMLVTAGYWETRLWDAASGQLIATCKYSAGAPAFHPAGTLLAVVPTQELGVVLLWDGTTGWQQLRQRPSGRGKAVGRFMKEWMATPVGGRGHGTPVGFSPDGRVIGACYGTAMAFLWDVDARELLTRLEGNCAIAFSRDSDYLATASRANTFLWELVTMQKLTTLAGRAPLFSPDGTGLATIGGGGAAMLWEVPTGRWSAVPPRRS